MNELECIQGNSLSSDKWNELQSLLPSQIKFNMKYMLCVCIEDPKVLLLYGITPLMRRHIILRMVESLKAGQVIKEKLQLSIVDNEKFKRDLKLKCEKSKIFMEGSKIIIYGRKKFGIGGAPKFRVFY